MDYLPENANPSRFGNLKNSISFRIIIVSIIALLLLIPAAMVQSMISERKWTSESAISEVSATWSEAQTVTGPILSIPYNEIRKDDRDKVVTVKLYAYFLPEELSINGNIEPETRHRGIYDVVVYRSKLSMQGSFRHLNFKALNINPENILWEQATVNVGISDLRGIENAVSLQWNESSLQFDPGISSPDVLSSGMSTPVKIDRQASDSLISFSLQLDLKGSGSMGFSPVGKITKVHIDSNWPNPSFAGAFLPDTAIFPADWQVLHLNRNFPQQWIGAEGNLSTADFQVSLYLPADQYQKSSRTAKYAFLFIALTFLFFFFTEVFNQKMVHPIQYLMVGFVLVLFFSLLIAFAEHIGFDMAYLVSSVSVVLLIGVYTRAIMSSLRIGLMAMLMLGILYGFIYVILQLEDFSLLMGSIGLFAVMAVVMIKSRNIDWYAISQRGNS